MVILRKNNMNSAKRLNGSKNGFTKISLPTKYGSSNAFVARHTLGRKTTVWKFARETSTAERLIHNGKKRPKQKTNQTIDTQEFDDLLVQSLGERSEIIKALSEV